MLQRIATRIASINVARPNASLTPTENNPMNKLNSTLAAALLVTASVSAQTIITIDRDYNGGANIAEYTAWDTSDPFNGLADSGISQFNNGTTAGVIGNGTQLRRPAFFFQLPTGYTSAQINDATLTFRLNSITTPTTDLHIYSAALDTLGTKNGAYAISTFSSAAFTTTGLSLATNAATATNYTFDITSLVKSGLDLSLTNTVIAFRFQMDDDTSLAYGTANSYTLLGFNTTAAANRPVLTLDVVPEPSTYALLAMSGLALGRYMIGRRRRA